MSIRRARIDDWESIAHLLDQLEYPGTEAFLEAKLAVMLDDPAEVLLVWDETVPDSTANVAPPSILGFLSLHFIPQIALRGDFARISYFAVDENARSLGIGRQLEEAASRLARERGCALLEVHCHSRRGRAHEFYRRQGWEESPKYLIKRLQPPPNPLT
jgi:GNAT superfamily N-acetyltransferase